MPRQHTVAAMTHDPVSQAAAGSGVEEWPLLDEYERPLTTRLDHLVANAPNIQTIDALDRRAAAQLHKQHTEDELAEVNTAPLSLSGQQQQARGAKRSRAVEDGPEEKTAPVESTTAALEAGGEEKENETKEAQLGEAQADELYDPLMDDRDEQRLQQSRALPSGRHSDAVLSCPCCLTTLCLDCQRHTDIAQQYRAMFVSHCLTTDRRVHPTSTAAHTSQQHSRRHKGAATGRSGESAAGTSSDVYLAVECSECGTEVGAVDGDEVYYFHNVLDSA